MSEFSDESNKIKETDIVFDCPYCAKSFAIDYRGAGLNIQCTDCGRNVQVPIPEGMEISDLDSSVEEQEIRILNLRRSLAMAEERIRELEDRLEAAQAVGTVGPANGGNGFQTVLDQMDVIQKAQAQILERLGSVTEAAADDD